MSVTVLSALDIAMNKTNKFLVSQNSEHSKRREITNKSTSMSCVRG